MSLSRFRQCLPAARYGKKDQNWFLNWLASYTVGKTRTRRVLPITRELVIEFSQSLLENQTLAWQRLQCVRAIEAYRDLVLESSEPCLRDIRQTLSRQEAKEKHT